MEEENMIIDDEYQVASYHSRASRHLYIFFFVIQYFVYMAL